MHAALDAPRGGPTRLECMTRGACSESCSHSLTDWITASRITASSAERRRNWSVPSPLALRVSSYQSETLVSQDADDSRLGIPSSLPLRGRQPTELPAVDSRLQ